MRRNVHQGWDHTLVALTLILVLMGLVMVFSSSAIWSEQHYKDFIYFLKRQILWTCIGITAMLLMSKLNYNYLQEWSHLLLAGTWIFLLAVLLSPSTLGTHRWLKLGFLSLQPSEFAKIGLIVVLSDYLDRKKSKMDGFKHGILIPLLLIGTTAFLVVLEADLGTPALMVLTGLIMLFIVGSPMRYILLLSAMFLPFLTYELFSVPYRRQRLLHFLSSREDAQGIGYQLSQSILAIGSGGLFGKGLGSSQMALLYLPTPHTDFIFPIIGEQLGLLGSLSVLLLYGWMALRGFRIAREAPNLFGTFLAVGITLSILLQSMLNIAVTVGLLPTKGLPLPLLSFGGSSLVSTLAGIGILLNISRQAKQ